LISQSLSRNIRQVFHLARYAALHSFV
jgi:hypothetical protein